MCGTSARFPGPLLPLRLCELMKGNNLKVFISFSYALNKRGLVYMVFVEYVCMTSSVSNAVAQVGRRRPVTALMFLINDSHHIL